MQHFKTNIRDIRSGYPHIHNWLRNLYWDVPAFHDTTEFSHIKNHYTKSHRQINPPVGPIPIGTSVTDPNFLIEYYTSRPRASDIAQGSGGACGNDSAYALVGR